MIHKEFEEYALKLPNTFLDFPFGKEISVYKVGDSQTKDSKMFALVQNGSSPLRVSLKCDPELALVLRDKYETVQPGYHLNKKRWNTIICSGQLDDQEFFDLVSHSYQLVTAQ